MINTRIFSFFATILLVVSALSSCKTNDKSDSSDSMDSLTADLADSTASDSATAARMISDFNNVIDSVYNGSAKNVFESLVEGSQRAAQQKSFITKAETPLPDSILRKKPFLLLTDIDMPRSLEEIFDIQEPMFIQMASPACLINQKQVAVMEYAVNYSATRVILILANGNSRIIGAASDHVQTDNFSAISQELAKAMNTTQEFADRSSANKTYISQIAQNQAAISVNQILSQSPTLKALEASGKIVLKSAVYNIDGSIKFLD